MIICLSETNLSPCFCLKQTEDLFCILKVVNAFSSTDVMPLLPLGTERGILVHSFKELLHKSSLTSVNFAIFFSFFILGRSLQCAFCSTRFRKDPAILNANHLDLMQTVIVKLLTVQYIYQGHILPILK